MTKFICVVGHQRSGTTVFRQMLESGEAIDLGEIFHQEFSQNETNFFHFLKKKIKKDEKYIHPDWHEEVFQDFLDLLQNNFRNNYVVIDIKYNALNFIGSGVIFKEIPLLINEISKRNSLFVHVYRKNKLRALVSELIAQRTGVWGVWGNDSETSSVRKDIFIDPNMALSRTYICEEFQSKVNDWLKNPLKQFEIQYEEMFEESGDFSEKSKSIASELLSVQKKNLNFESVSLRKQNPESLQELITNFDDVDAAFSCTEYGWMTRS